MSDLAERDVHEDLPWISRFTRYVGPRLPMGLRGRLRQLLFDLKSFHKTLPSGLQARIESFADWEIYCEVFGERIYDLAIDKAVADWDRRRSLRFVDLGANVGYFTLRLADALRQRFGSSIELAGTLIDGNAAVVEQLRRRLVDDNHLMGLEIMHGLAGRRDGVGAFHTAPRHGHSSLETSEPGTAVPFVDLEALCVANKSIDLLKMDIEGAELLVLETYPELFRKVRVASLELHDAVCDTQRCKALLHEAGLRHAHEWRIYETASLYTVWR